MMNDRTSIAAQILAGLVAARAPRGDRLDCSDVSILTGVAVQMADALIARLATPMPCIARFDEGGVELMEDGSTVPF
jgi:hypothetical protein